jgi:NitT/TauT family transport system substrate-binding protein
MPFPCSHAERILALQPKSDWMTFPNLRRSTFTAGALAALAAPAVRPAHAAGLTKIQAGSSFEDDAGVVIYGNASGVFSRLGLDVNVVKMASGSAGAAAVAGGALDVAKGSVIAVVAAHAHGIPFVVIAPSTLFTVDHPISGIVVRADSPIRTGADLNGKTIGVASLVDSRILAIRAWVDQNGGDAQTLKLLEIPTATIVAALDAGRIDATAASDPSLFDALATGRVKNIGEPNAAVAKRYVITAWFTTRDYAQRNADVIRRFRSGLQTSAVYANGHPKEMAQYIAPFTGIEEAKLRQWTRAQVSTTPITPADIQPIIEVAAKYHYIEKSFPASEIIFSG